MSQIIKGEITCPKCSNKQECSSYSSMNVSLNPELKNEFFSNKWNIFKCNACGISAPIMTDMMYLDMTNRFIVWYIPNGNIEQKIQHLKKYDRILENDNYYLNPIVVENREDTIMMVQLCEKNGPPISKEREKDYFEMIQAIRCEYKKIDPILYPTLATYQPEQIKVAVQKLQAKFPDMTEQQCLINLEMDLAQIDR
ncbi:MAG: CpXC domain-containing protein [Candidatus Pacearchaeota archaeon]